MSQYLWNGVYRRDFQNGLVLVNPTNSTITLDLGQTYEQATGSGGGVLDASSLDAAGNYIGGTLNETAVNSVTLQPGSAAILLTPTPHPLPGGGFETPAIGRGASATSTTRAARRGRLRARRAWPATAASSRRATPPPPKVRKSPSYRATAPLASP